MHEQQQTITPDMREITPTAAHYIQSRAQMDFALVDEYAQMMRDGVEFDAAQGVEDADGTIYIYDGYHRGEAAKHINSMLRVRVQPGTRADAEWLAFAANKSHGLRRTHADIERIVKNALAHPKAASLSDREIARHCGTDHKTVGNWRKRLEKDAEQQRRADSDETPSQNDATQTEIKGAERFWSVEEIKSVLCNYINVHSYLVQINILQNLTKRTAAGAAYYKEMSGLLQGKDWSDGILYALARNELESLTKHVCATCGTSSHRVAMFKHGARWYCAKCFPAVQKQRDAANETATAREIEDIENVIMAKLPQNDLALEALREVMMTDISFDELCKQLPGFPTWLIRQAVSTLHKRLSLARTLTTPPTLADGEAHELTDDYAETQPPEPEMQMRCMGCGAMFPACKLTHKTGLCETCLNHQLTLMTERQPMMAAAFRVIDRMLMECHADEIKREIYEEIYAPTPEGEPMPELKRIQPEPAVKIADFQFYQEDRTKLVKAGLRLFRANWHERQIKELSNIGSWRAFEEFDSKKAMQARIKELMKDPICVMENHDIERQVIEPAAQPEPERVTCDACGKSFRPDQITEYNGRKLHTDCYYAAVNAHNAEMAQIADDLSENMPDPIKRVMYYKQQGLSVRKIADALKTEGITLSKSAVDRIIQDNKGAQI